MRRKKHPLAPPAVVLLAATACGDADVTAPGAAEDGIAITWGSTGIIFTSQNDNLRLIRNYLVHLGQDRQIGSETRILYTFPCDPRTDPGLCQLASDFATLEPFFEVVEEVGTVEFGTMSETARDEYSLVIADFCHGLRTAERRALIAPYLAAGGRALLLADNFCFPNQQTSSAAAANTVLEPLGVHFTDLDPADRTPLDVSSQGGTELLEGVDSLFIFRVVPQEIEDPFQAVLESNLGVLSAVARFPN